MCTILTLIVACFEARGVTRAELIIADRSLFCGGNALRCSILGASKIFVISRILLSLVRRRF